MPKRASTTARASELDKFGDLYRQVVECAPNAMVMADRRGKIVLLNKKAEELFGYERGELLGEPIETLLPERFRAGHVAHRKGFSEAPQTRAMGAGRDLFGRRKDGVEVPVEIGLNPIRFGAETLVLAAIIDITERKELQRKLSRIEALAAVGTMSAIVAHEIRNPLGSIVLAAKSLVRDDLSQDDRQTVSAILSTESQRLNRTLQDFLDFARPRDPRLADSDLNRQVKEIVHVLAADKGVAGEVKIDLSLDKSLAAFPYDPDQIRQVLWNLILNGIQAMEQRGRLKVSTRRDDKGAFFEVADSGPGIAPNDLEKIFDPFFTTKKKGTGLGLAIARRIIEAHGGRITAGNEPRGGARFSFALPISRA